MMWISLLKQFWKPVAIGLVAVLLFWKISAAWSDYKEWKEEQAQTITDLTSQRDRSRIEAASAQSALWEKEAQIKRLELLYEEVLLANERDRDLAREQQAIFERHNFTALTEAKPGLIEKLANKATQERMDEFEDAFNQ